MARYFAKRVLAAIVLLLGLGGLCIGASADTGFSIDRYRFEGVLSANNVMHVTETEEITFHEPRHGITRSIPTEFTLGTSAPELGGGRDTRYRAKVRGVRVAEAPFKVSREGAYTDIRIGDAQRTVTGGQVYTISYDYAMQADRLDTCDFLFYSVLGPENTTTVGEFSFSIRFEKPVPEEWLAQARLYSGQVGSTRNDLDVQWTLDADGITGSVSNVRPGRAVTVLLPLPEGYFAGAWHVPLLPSLAAAGAGLIGGLYGLFRALLTRKRRAEQTVEHYPPEGITSADAGMIIDDRADDIDLISLIPAWAEQGYINIEQVSHERGILSKRQETGLLLTRVRELPKGAPNHEKLLFKALFRGGETRDLTEPVEEAFVTRLDEAKAELASSYTGDRALTRGQGAALLCTFVPALLYGLLLGFCSPRVLSDNLILGGWAALHLLAIGIIALRMHFGRVKTALRKVLWALAIAVIFLMPLWITFASIEEEAILPDAVYWAGLALSTLCALAGGRLEQPTDFRLQYQGRLLGLKEFLRTADEAQIRALKEETPGYYYKLLPYAMAFGLADNWAACFQGLTVEPPLWYTGYDAYWDYRIMTGILDRALREPVRDVRNRARQESSASSSASDGGGGGFSGGGGGGGGTSSW